MIGELSGLGSAAMWALVSTVMRTMSNRISPVVVNGLRCFYAAVITAVIILVLGRQDVLLTLPVYGVALIVVSGMLGQGLGDAVFVASMKSIGAARAMPISSIQPLLTTTLAVVFLGEQVSWVGVAGTGLVILSVYVLAFPYGPLLQMGRMIAGADRRGILLALGAATCWAFSAVLLRQAVTSIDILSTNLIRMTVAAAMLLGFQLLAFRGKAASGVDRRALGILALAGLLGTISSMGYVTAVTYAGAAKAAVLTSTTPLFGLPLSLFVLRERINSRILMGSLLCVFGIWMVLLG